MKTNKTFLAKGSLPFVSVIIPNYNYSRYLDSRIQSVLNQTYSNYEVIILDDKSTDDSIEIIRCYESNPHISGVYINENNSGNVFSQWQKGIRLAKGEIIWIAESDDFCESSFLEDLIDEWIKVPGAAAAHAGYILVDEGSKELCKSKERQTRVIDGPHYLKTRMSRGCSFRNASGAIFRREYALKVSDEFTLMKSAGDYLFWSQLCSFGSVIEVHKNLTYYRIHNSSVTSNNYTKGITAVEDKIVFDYINNTVGLSRLQRFMAMAAHHSLYSQTQYESEEIYRNILSEWGLVGGVRPLVFEKFLLWLVGSIERHFGLIL